MLWKEEEKRFEKFSVRTWESGRARAHDTSGTNETKWNRKRHISASQTCCQMWMNGKPVFLDIQSMATSVVSILVLFDLKLVIFLSVVWYFYFCSICVRILEYYFFILFSSLLFSSHNHLLQHKIMFADNYGKFSISYPTIFGRISQDNTESDIACEFFFLSRVVVHSARYKSVIAPSRTNVSSHWNWDISVLKCGHVVVFPLRLLVSKQFFA